MRHGRKCQPMTMKRRRKTGRKVHLQLVQAPYDMDGPQAFGLQIGQEGQGRSEKGPQQGQLCCRCLYGHQYHQSSLHGPLGHSCKPQWGRMMVRTSMHLEYDVSMHGWANWSRTINHDLPFQPIPTYYHLLTILPCLPYQKAWQRQSTRQLLGASGGTLALFDVKESRNTRNLLDNIKAKTKPKEPKAKCFLLTYFQLFLPPSRLVVA